MRRLFNVLCCIAATCASPLHAQDPGEPPAPADAMSAYRAVDSWVREWKVGDEPVPACTAASVTLRLSGDVVGRAMEVAADDAARSGIIAHATRAALADAEPRLAIPRDAMYETTLKDIAKRITISLQLAGDLIPISPQDSAEAMAMVAPGVEGVAARLGNRLDIIFPERMLTTSTEPGPALGTLIGKLADDPTLAVEPLSKLAKDRSAVFYRFRVTHLAQAKVGDTTVFLHRCGRVVPRSQIDEANLKRWAEKLAINLLERPWRGDGKYGMVGTFDPVTGRFESPHASAYEQALVGYALLSYFRTAFRPRQWRENIEPDLNRWIADVVSDLAEVESGEDDPASDPATAALTVRLLDWVGVEPMRVTGGVHPSIKTPALVGLKERCIATTQKAIDGHTTISDARLALALCVGPTAAGTITDNPDALDGIYNRLGTPMLSSAMPWLGWAEQRRGGSKVVQTAIALREMRSLLWQHQLQPDSLPPNQQDLAGGILFTASPQPMPTWHMARPLAFVATMLGDPRLTEDHEVAEELSRLLLSLRFLRQLTVGEAEGFMYKHPDRAIGGVRSSLWDQRMPPEATAMTLLTVCETLRSLDQIRERREKAAPPQGR